MVVDDFATVPTRCTLSCTLQEPQSRRTSRPKPFREPVRVSGKSVWSMAKVASNISSSVPNLRVWAWPVGRGGENRSCGERRADQGTVFCASLLAPIRLHDIRPNVTLAMFFEPDVARSFCTYPRVADTFKLDAANASQALCDWLFSFSVCLE